MICPPALSHSGPDNLVQMLSLMPSMLHSKEADLKLFKLQVGYLGSESMETAYVCVVYLAVKLKSTDCLSGV